MQETNVYKLIESSPNEKENSLLKNTSEIFGVSSLELESEFISYKIQKFLKVIDYLALNEKSELSLKEKVSFVQKSAIGSITCMPARIDFALKYAMGKDLTINSVIGYPNGDEFSKSKIVCAKKLAKTKVFSVFTPVSSVMLGYYRIDQTEKELKKIRKILKNKKFNLQINIDELSNALISTFAKIAILCKVDGVIIGGDLNQIGKIKALMDLLSNKITLCAQGELTVSQVNALFKLGVNSISATNSNRLVEAVKNAIKN